MNVTQKHIAEKLGLSQKAVSQAFAHKGRLSVDTREKILNAAKEMGYRPNFSAQAVRSGKQCRIGLLLGETARLSHCRPNV